MWWLCALLSLALADADLVLNEVLFDPEGPDTGFEFVELYNPSSTSIPLAGLTLEFLNGSAPLSPVRVWVGPAGAMLGAREFLVLGGEGVRSRDYPLSGSLQNGDEGLRLRDGERIVDAVAWGEVDLGLGEGAPVRGAPGRSIGRVPDGEDKQDNAADLRVLPAPSPGQINLAADQFSLVDWWFRPAWSEVAAPVRVHLALQAVGWAPDQSGVVRVGASRFPLSALAGETTQLSAELDCSGGPASVGLSIDVASGAPVDLELPLHCGVSSLVFTEVQVRPGTEEPEWIEILNRGAEQVALDGWRIRDKGGRGRRLQPSRALAPGERHLVTADRQSFLATYPALAGAVSEALDGWPVLNDGGPDSRVAADSLHLVDPRGAIVDLVTWTPADVAERGRPLQRGAIRSGQTSIWLPSLTGPSPGRGAPDETRVWPPQGLSCRPDPFDPAQDELEVLVVGGWSAARASILDLRGDTVRELELVAAGDRLAARWDGLDARSTPAPSGAYVIVVEARRADGSTDFLRRLIGLGRP